MANLAKAAGFQDQHNWVQLLHYGELAATKLKQLKDRRLETVQAINDALIYKFDALKFMARHREAMEYAKERYTLWAINHMRNPGSMRAALSLIESCLNNGEFEDAVLYAREAMFMINEMADNFIPTDLQPWFLAEGSYYLAQAIFRLAHAGGIPPEEKQKAGVEAIALARQALEIYIQLHGTESAKVANSTGNLADILDFFNDVDDDEFLRLHEQSIAIYRRVQGSSSYNVAAGENQLGNAYYSRSKRAYAARDLDRCLANLELALPHYREAARIFQAISHVDMADNSLHHIAKVEEMIRMVAARLAAAATTTTTRA